MTVFLKVAFVFIKAYQKRNQKKGPEKRLAGLEKYSLEQLFFISYTRVIVILSSSIIINHKCKLDIYIYTLCYFDDFIIVFLHQHE